MQNFVKDVESPTGAIEAPVLVLLKVDIDSSEVDVLCQSHELEEARELLEEYAFGFMSTLSARDESFPQVDSAVRHPNHRLANPTGCGMNALACDEIPIEELRPGEYVTFFEPQHERLEFERTDAERIYVGRRPHPEDSSYNPEDANVVVNIAYFSIQQANMNIRAFLRARTEISDVIERDQIDVSQYAVQKE
jgi:hypothetical protein